jgi:hypothetical protein
MELSECLIVHIVRQLFFHCLQSDASLRLHILNQKSLYPVRNLRCAFRLESWVNLFWHTLYGKGRSPVCVTWDACLILFVEWTVSERDIVSLPLALVWPDTSLHNSQESNTSVLCNSDNSALCSPRGSSNLTSLMKCAASVWVAFNLTLWKEKKLYQGLQWKEFRVILQCCTFQLDIPLHEHAARWRCVRALPTQNKLP